MRGLFEKGVGEYANWHEGAKPPRTPPQEWHFAILATSPCEVETPPKTLNGLGIGMKQDDLSHRWVIGVVFLLFRAPVTIPWPASYKRRG